MGNVVMEGFFYIGRFERLERKPAAAGSDFGPTDQVVISTARYDGSRWEQSFMFKDADRDTGEQTAASVQLRRLPVGSLVGIKVRGKATKAGTGVWYEALGGVVLDTGATAKNGKPEHLASV